MILKTHYLRRFVPIRFGRTGIVTLMSVLAVALTTPVSAADDQQVPRYKPSSRSPAPLDIRTNAYGASQSAPNALNVGDKVPDFSAPKPGGGLVSLRSARKQGPVAIIFYRGHW
jgi:hypothetical protein